MNKTGFIVIIVICVVLFFATASFLVIVIRLTNERTITGTIERVELLSDLFTGSSCIVAFSNGNTVILDYSNFAKANNYVDKNVTMIYRKYGNIISITEE